MKIVHRRGLTPLAVAVAVALAATPVHAASHREAPLMTLDPAADITDVYAFVSYDAADVAAPLENRKVTLIMNVIPGQEPGSGPNYYAFDDNVLYALHVDDDRDGVDDITYELQFATEVDSPDQGPGPVGLPLPRAARPAWRFGSRHQRTEGRPLGVDPPGR